MSLQDKICTLAPNTVSSLLVEKGDVLMVGSFSGLTVSHTASLIADKNTAGGRNKPTVYVCVGDRTDAQRDVLLDATVAMGCKSRQ